MPFNWVHFYPFPPTDGEGVDIALLLRVDKASTQKAVRSKIAVQKLLIAISGEKGLSFTILDWKIRLAMFDAEDYLFTDTAIQILS